MKTSNAYSQRLVFTVAMTCLATLFGSLMAIYELHWQSDVVIDVIKITSVLALGTAIASYVFWRLTHIGGDSLKRGGLAGGLTGFAIIQLPFFASAFKTAFLANTAEGVVASFLAAILPAIKSGLMTFQIITKVSLIALVASITLGVLIAKIIPPRQDET